MLEGTMRSHAPGGWQIWGEEGGVCVWWAQRKSRRAAGGSHAALHSQWPK